MCPKKNHGQPIYWALFKLSWNVMTSYSNSSPPLGNFHFNQAVEIMKMTDEVIELLGIVQKLLANAMKN